MDTDIDALPSSGICQIKMIARRLNLTPSQEQTLKPLAALVVKPFPSHRFSGQVQRYSYNSKEAM